MTATKAGHLRAALRELYDATHAFLDVRGYPPANEPTGVTARLNGALGDAFTALHRKDTIDDQHQADTRRPALVEQRR